MEKKMLALVLYVIAIVVAGLAAFGVSSKINLLALAVAFFAAAELVSHASA